MAEENVDSGPASSTQLKKKWMEYLSTLLMQAPLLETFCENVTGVGNSSGSEEVSVSINPGALRSSHAGDDERTGVRVASLARRSQSTPSVHRQQPNQQLLPVEAGQCLGDDGGGHGMPMFLTSLVDLLCAKLHADDPDRQRKLFRVLSQVLVQSRFVSPIVVADELSPLRLQYRLVLNTILETANRLIAPPSPTPAIPGPSTGLQPVSHPHRQHEGNDSCGVCRMSNWRSFFSHRYRSEFHEESELGRGGFGQVFRSRCTIDGCTYAVKKIRFGFSDSPLAFRVLSEVRTLARLNHAHIVRYHCSWFELDSDRPSTTLHTKNGENTTNTSHGVRHRRRRRMSIQIHDDEESVTNAHHISGANGTVVRRRSVSNPSSSHGRAHDDDQSSVVFERSRPSGQSRRSSDASSAWRRMPRYADDASVATTSSPGMSGGGGAGRRKFWQSPAASSAASDGVGDTAADKRLVPLHNQQEHDLYSAVRNLAPSTRGFILYLQMELCMATLRGYLVERNTTEKSLGNSKFDVIDVKFNKRVLSQLLEAVDYVHSQGLVHRDIKPSNIFLRDLTSGHLLLGDFGLACRNGGAGSSFASPSSDAQRHPNDVVVELDEGQEQAKSSGVGTYTYSAPEQLNQHGNYGAKVDMFSVGIVAYEMYFPFSTYMEKIHHLMGVRKGRLAEEFQQQWPIESGVIKQLVNLNPALRPSASQLLKEVYGYSTQTSNEQHIKSLEAKLREKDAEIARLRELMTPKSNV